MAKEKIISRSVATTNFTMLCALCDEGTIEERTVTVNGKLNEKNKAKLTKQAIKTIEKDPNLKVLKTVSTTESTKIFGMPVSTFMEHAKEITR